MSPEGGEDDSVFVYLLLADNDEWFIEKDFSNHSLRRSRNKTLQKHLTTCKTVFMENCASSINNNNVSHPD